MTLGELYDAVACLGFETALDDEVLRRSFYAVLGRAMQSVDRLCPRVRRVAVSHIAPRELLGCFEVRRVGDGEVLTVSLPEGAELVSVSVFGRGRVLLADVSGEREESFSSVGESLISFRCRGARALSVAAEQDVTVGAISAYASVSPLGRVLPRRGICYDAAVLCPDFSAFSTPALYLDGRSYLGKYELRGSELLLDLNAPSGLYELECRLAMPRFLPTDDPSLELPLSPELAALLPELVASLIWLDDAPEKATYYASLYQRSYAQLRAEMRGGEAQSVFCPNGW